MTTSKPDPLPPDVSEANRLLEQAVKQPGVAELLRLYQEHAETMRKAEPYVRPHTKVTIFSTGNATA